MNNTWGRLAVFVLTAMVGAFFVFQSSRGLFFVNVGNIDFDIHYFGAIVERVGSYTEVERVRQLQLDVRPDAQTEGVIGTPALVAIIYLPLSYLSLADAEIAWKVFAITAIATGAWSALGRRRWFAVPLTLCASPVLYSLYVGNVSALNFALVAFAFGALKRNHDRSAGIAIGITIAFKLFPALLLLPLLVQRRFQAVKWAVLAAVAASLVAVAVLGVHDFALGMQRTFAFGSFDVRADDNVSIPGIVFWETGKVGLAWAVLGATALVGFFLLFRKRSGDDAAVFAGGALVMLLANPLSWSHYFGMATIGFLALWDRARSRAERATIATLAVATLHPTMNTKLLTVGSAVALLLLIASLRREAIEDPRPEPVDVGPQSVE